MNDPHDDPDLADIVANEVADVRFVPGHFEWLPVDEIEPHPLNPNEGDLGALCNSLDQVGFYGVIYVQDAYHSPSKMYRIIAGEHRWRALVERGGARAPCWVLDTDDETAFRMLMADNRITRLGHDDPTRVLENLIELHDTDLGLPAGYDTDDLESLRVDAERSLADSLRQSPPPPGDPDLDRGPMGLMAECPNCGHHFRLGDAG